MASVVEAQVSVAGQKPGGEASANVGTNFVERTPVQVRWIVLGREFEVQATQVCVTAEAAGAFLSSRWSACPCSDEAVGSALCSSKVGALVAAAVAVAAEEELVEEAV
jgi:hypothetical protein